MISSRLYGFRSIRNRLAVLIFAPLLIVAGYAIYQEYDEYQQEREAARTDLARVTSLVADSKRELIVSARERMLLASTSPRVRDAAQRPDDATVLADCHEALASYALLLPNSTGFGVVDKEGRLLCTSVAPDTAGVNVSDRVWFQRVRDTEAFATGEFVITRITNVAALSFGLPLVDVTGEVIGYLSTGLVLDKADSLVTASRLPDGSSISVVDHRGVIVDSSDGVPGDPAADFDEISRLSGVQGVATIDGGLWLGSEVITEDGDLPVYVVVRAPSDALVEPFGERIVGELLLMPAVIALTALALWLLAERWFARPLGELQRGQEALAAGKLSSRVEVQDDGSEFGELTRGFNRMATSLESATRAKDDFLGMLSHELKTPITTVMGNAEVLHRRRDMLTPEMRDGAIADIHAGASRLHGLIDNLLLLARLERGMGLDREPLALRRLVDRVVAAHKLDHQARPISVGGDESVFALGGETLVEQVLRNLVGNAEKYSAADAPIEVRLSKSATMATVRVLDGGPGIAEDEITSVFEPFYRSARTAESAEGVGIGLSVCKRLIEAMGGEIWVRERPEGGCEFGFTLPLMQASGVDEPTSSRRGATGGVREPTAAG